MCFHPEKTFIALKPDGVIRGLIGEIIRRLEKRGYSQAKQVVTLMVASNLRH
jgi:nucleoside diphosphate kinase